MKWLVSTAEIYTLKLVPKLKSNELLKLMLLDMKVNSSILIRLEWQGWHRISRNALFSFWSVKSE